MLAEARQTALIDRRNSAQSLYPPTREKALAIRSSPHQLYLSTVMPGPGMTVALAATGDSIPHASNGARH